MVFRYKAVNAHGAYSEGQLDAADTRAAVYRLQSMGLIPVSIEEPAGRRSSRSKGIALRRVTELHDLCPYLSNLTHRRRCSFHRDTSVFRHSEIRRHLCGDGRGHPPGNDGHAVAFRSNTELLVGGAWLGCRDNRRVSILDWDVLGKANMGRVETEVTHARYHHLENGNGTIRPDAGHLDSERGPVD